MTDPIDTAHSRRAWEETTRAVQVLEGLKYRTPDYMGNAPKAQHYQGIHAAYDAAIAALTAQPALLDEIERLRGENARLREAAAMAVAEMSRARGRLETIAMCNEDRRIAAALGGTCDFVRTAALGEKA